MSAFQSMLSKKLLEQLGRGKQLLLYFSGL